MLEVRQSTASMTAARVPTKDFNWAFRRQNIGIDGSITSSYFEDFGTCARDVF